MFKEIETVTVLCPHYDQAGPNCSEEMSILVTVFGATLYDPPQIGYRLPTECPVHGALTLEDRRDLMLQVEAQFEPPECEPERETTPVFVLPAIARPVYLPVAEVA